MGRAATIQLNPRDSGPDNPQVPSGIHAKSCFSISWTGSLTKSLAISP
jgi:hypothetical protein